MRTAPQKNHKNVEDPLNGDDPKIKGKLKNEDNLKNKDDLKMKMIPYSLGICHFLLFL